MLPIPARHAWTSYYFAAGNRIAMRVQSNQQGIEDGLYYLLTDHLGSTALTLDEGGNQVAELRYSAWGEARYTNGETPTQRRYTGQLEAEAGLYFYNARYYDPTLGRFLSPDSIITELYNPLSNDRYAYVNSNPINFNDPSGHMQACADGDLGGGCGSDGTSFYILDKYMEKKENGTSVSWEGLTAVEQSALGNDGWNPDVWQDAIGGQGVADVDPLHDPAFWVISVLSVARLSPVAITAIAEYFCLDGDCGNELEVSNHLLNRMGKREVSIDQLQQALQLKPFRYFHEGVWKLGYYDVANRIFVAVDEVTQKIITVITNVQPQYIENLQKVVP